MANKCAICGADINLFQTQKLADGNCICRKNCCKKNFKCVDLVHASLPYVTDHIAQVERGTKFWNHYFAPKLKEKDKNKKLVRFGADLYVAADLGLMAYTQTDYKFMMFGKTVRACVYRIADLRSYRYEERLVSSGDKTENKPFAILNFINTSGMSEVALPISGSKECEKLQKYFDTLFGIQKTLGNVANTWKAQTNAIKNVAAGLSAVVKGDADADAKAAEAVDSVDTALYGDRTELIKKADEALAAFNGQ